MSALSPSLVARVAALERQVASLRGQVGGGEQLSPNYLTASPSGQVGALFAGGVSIPEQLTSSPAEQTSFNFTGSGPGGINEFILGWVNAGIHQLLLMNQPDGADLASINMVASASGPSGSAGITAFAEDSSSGGHTVELVRSDGASSFLQLLSAQKLQMNVGGPVAINWPGGSPMSNLSTVAHGLGRTPKFAAPILNGVNLISGQWSSADATNNLFGFSTTNESSPVAGNFGNFVWLAIG